MDNLWHLLLVAFARTVEATLGGQHVSVVPETSQQDSGMFVAPEDLHPPPYSVRHND
jgi:hypothetical protein